MLLTLLVCQAAAHTAINANNMEAYIVDNELNLKFETRHRAHLHADWSTYYDTEIDKEPKNEDNV